MSLLRLSELKQNKAKMYVFQRKKDTQQNDPPKKKEKKRKQKERKKEEKKEGKKIKRERQERKIPTHQPNIKQTQATHIFKIRSKTHKRLKERLLIRQNRTKRARWQSTLFQIIFKIRQLTVMTGTLRRCSWS